MVLLSTLVLYPYLSITVVMLGYDWWLRMVINISVVVVVVIPYAVCVGTYLSIHC